MQTLLSKLTQRIPLTREEYAELLSAATPKSGETLLAAAGQVAQQRFGRGIYVRGLIEISNICANDCYYCGIRRSNDSVERYRLSREEVLKSCKVGYEIGFRTFVLQGGEDPYWRGSRLVGLVRDIRHLYPDCAITLSLGEMSRDEYQRLYDAGANRYLLRHETYDALHYDQLHPPEMKRANRLQCLRDLRDIGYQVGTGIMVGSPGQTPAHMAEDLAFIAELQPHMIGVGPFIPHRDTPLGTEPAGDLEMTLRFVSLCRLICPDANIPATTAVATLHSKGRLSAIRSGANVVMPNLSPTRGRALYSLYNDKAYSGSEAAEGVALLQQELDSIGYHIEWSRGDYVSHR